MAVTEQTPRNTSTAAAGATVFPYSFKIASSSDLEVTVDGQIKALTTDYTLSGVGNDAGGNVTFVTPLVGGEVVTRRRAMPLRRQTDYQNLGDLRADTINKDFDAVVMMVQQLADRIGSIADPPLRTSVCLSGPLSRTVNAGVSPPVAVLPMEDGKIYRVRVTGTCRFSSLSPGCVFRFYGATGFAGTATGMATWLPEGQMDPAYTIQGQFLRQEVLFGTEFIPPLSAGGLLDPCAVSVDMVVRLSLIHI